VRYEAVNAMLLNEFLKEHRQVQEQQKQIEKLTAQLNEQAEQIRKVNDKLEMNPPTPQIAVNDRCGQVL
jgi:cell division protein FtsB